MNFRTLSPLYAIIFLGFFGYALTIALFIPMIADEHFGLLSPDTSTSLRTTLSGLLLAAYPLGQFLGSPIIGKFSDHYGRKKVLTLSLFACALGFCGIALSIEYQTLPCLFLSCFLTGLFESNMAISQSVIADNCTDAIKKAKWIGYAFSACSLGYIAGPLVGGLSATEWGYSTPFWLTALGVLFLLIWVQSKLRKDNPIKAHRESLHLLDAVLTFKTIFTRRGLCRLYFINFLIFFAVQGLYRVVPLYVEHTWQPTLSTFTLLIAYVSILCFLANLLLMEWAAKKFRTEALLKILLILGGASTIFIVIPNNFSWIWLTYGIAVIPTVMLLTTCTTWLSNHASVEEQGQILGNNQALLVLGECLSAAAGGLVAAIMVSLPVIAAGIILLMASLMLGEKQKNAL